ncbi:GNAT family N-acetyltransferase [Pleionea mediterranea]|uniref:N-acetylglutamate synthase-like GNAT family acetyltransferase n=1 Tax=Pleionea mediterranea TaxID=523701 RepID=A0A316FSQ1_9GAMM|nr:GNAT family N-acetyltransferase [Pleionea mediterranea]PWK50746.1 N-acetylglutamate synthase-like GNAT family acetyltransferase [Pleionea mediterranea]
MQFKFQKATIEDRNYLLELRKLTMVEHLEKSGQFLSELEHERRLDENYECSYLIVHHDEVIGTLKYREFDEKIEIMQLQIHPDYQSKGLGGKVLEQVLEYSKPKYLELTVLKENRALNLYKKLGFSVFGEDQLEFFMHTKH